MSNFFYRQAGHLLQSKLYAYFLVMALALVPFAAWLSLSIVALVTLRKGGQEGLKILLPLLSLVLINSSQHNLLPFELPAVLLSCVLTYLGALALRGGLHWSLIISSMLAFALLLIALIKTIWPEMVLLQLNALISLFQKSFPHEAMVQQLSNKSGLAAELLANYLLGIKMGSLVLSALMPLMLARQTQSVLYYPKAFREEILNFRAAKIIVLCLMVVALGAYQRAPWAVAFLPPLLVYVMAAGMLVFFKALSRKKDWMTMLFLFVPLIIAPYVMLPVYVLFGSLDSWFHFKLRLPSRAGE